MVHDKGVKLRGYISLRQLVLEGKGRYVNRQTKTANKDYDKYYCYIPSGVAKDSTFPFKPGEEVIVRIDKKRLIIERA